MGFNRATHTSDGYGLKLLMRNGIRTGVISGGDSQGVRKRFIDNLKLDFAYLGDEDKRSAFQKVLDEGYEPEEILYMGDEFFDVPLLQKAGFAVTVPDASYEVKQFADYVTETPGGHGAAREIIEIIRYARGIVPEVLDFDGNKIDFKKTWP
jgi:3-deoxy-D-manno-octulosonate 8-phosphate phosphatase (KDO 8-P phosphatase)